MNQTEIIKKATKLAEGRSVYIGGLWVKAESASNDLYPCENCKLNRVCTQEYEWMMDICSACDRLTNTKHVLRVMKTGR